MRQFDVLGRLFLLKKNLFPTCIQVCNIIIEFHKAPLILGSVMANSIGFILLLVFWFGVTVLAHAQQQTG